MNAVKWVLIDETDGAATQDGSKLSATVLANIAEAVTNQMNQEFNAEWGAQVTIRAGAGPKDIRPDELGYTFVGALPPPSPSNASAYHDITQKGKPFAICAVRTCVDLYGPNGVSVDASHEILETAGDQGANAFANDDKGMFHALEMCDAVEVQTYGKTSKDGTIVHVSNWLLRSWFIPGASGPYDYMSFAKLAGAVSPAGPLQTANGKGGNYQIICKAGSESQVTAFSIHHEDYRIEGHRRKGEPHWSSRAGYRLAQLEKALEARKK